MATPTEAQLASASPSQLLHLASDLGRTDLIVSALRAGASITFADNNQQTALHHAVLNSHVDATRALLAAGASLSQLDSLNKSPINLATNPAVASVIASHVCQRAAVSDLTALNDATNGGYDWNMKDGGEAGDTALHWAACYGQVEAVRYILQQGVNVDIPNNKQITPLKEAVKYGFVDVVRVLREGGADLNVEDVVKDPEMMAVLRGHHEIEMDKVERQFSDEVPVTPYYVPGERGGGWTRSDVPEWAKLLWPKPQRIIEGTGGFTVPPIVTISAENECMQVAKGLKEKLIKVLPFAEYSVRICGGGQGGLGEAIAFSASIFLRVDDSGLERKEEGYKIVTRDWGIDVVGGDLNGVFYGCAMLAELVKVRVQGKSEEMPLSLPGGCIIDWPSIRKRGLIWDLNGGRVPRMECLKKVIEVLGGCRFNMLQIRLGGNFERLDTSEGRVRISHEDLLELGRVCREHFIELVPVVEEERPVGEVNGEGKAGMEKLYDEFLPLFDGRLVNVGDPCEGEAWELSDFEKLRGTARSLRSRGKSTLMVSGKKIVGALGKGGMTSGALAELPSRCVLIMKHDSEDSGKFQKDCLQLQKAGLSFYTCASSMLRKSFAGRTSACLKGCATIIETAVEQGAAGVLLQDSSLSLQGAPLVFLYQALLTFGGGAWNTTYVIKVAPSGPDDLLPRLYDQYIFGDPVEKGILGSIAVSLGDLHRVAGDVTGGALFDLLGKRDEEFKKAIEGLSYPGLRRALKRADRIENALASYSGNANHFDVAELHASATLLGAAARLGAWLSSPSSANSADGIREEVPSVSQISSLADGRRSDLCNALLQAIELLRSAWMARYREHGFTESVELLTGEALTKLAAGMPYQRYLENRKAEGWAPTDES